MPQRPYFARPVVKVNGQELDAHIASLVDEVIVDQSLIHPDMFEIRLRENRNGDVLTRSGLRHGSSVKLECVSARAGGGVLIEGEVTALESRLDAQGVQVVIRGYDKSHRLHSGRRTQTFKNAKISDVAQQMASAAGLQPGDIKDSGTVLDVVSQHNQTDWEFLIAHADELGCEVTVEAGKLNFRLPPKSSDAPQQGTMGAPSDPRTLIWGEDLLEFHPRLSGAQQVGEVEVRSWDPEEKKAVVSSAPVASDHATLAAGPGTLADVFGATGARYSHVSTPHRKPDQADRDARSLAQEVGSSFAEADGMCLGTPVVKAGAQVTISHVGAQFTGKYTITTARHSFDNYDGYVTRFTINGRQDRSLLGLATGGVGQQADFHGVVCALVTDNNDPAGKGRVKLKFPWLSDTYETDWARMTQPGAGPDSGMGWLPEVNDEVLVSFEHGDMRHPYVLGALHNGKDLPMLGSGLLDNGKVKRRGLISRTGHKLIFFDDAAKSGIAIHSASGKLTISMNEQNGEIKIHADKKVTIVTDSDKVSIKAGGEMELIAQKKLTLQGSQVAITASGDITMSGTPIKLN